MYKGVILSILASITFGVLYFYTQFLKPFDSEQTFAWRMLATLPFLSLFMWWLGDLKYINEIFKRIVHQPTILIWLIVSSFYARHSFGCSCGDPSMVVDCKFHWVTSYCP